MFARVTELVGASGVSGQDDLRFFEAEILPEVEEIPGMSGGLLLVDRQSRRAMAIILYVDEETLVDSREQAQTLRELAFQRMNLTSAPQVREYDVVIARLREQVGGPAER